jgi:hypothetical protein
MDFHLLDRFGMVSELVLDILLYLTIASRRAFVMIHQLWELMEVSTYRSNLQHTLMKRRLRSHSRNT